MFFAGFLLALNIFAWKEVFVLSSDRNLKVVFFDVGQGDSAFIETPEGHQIIIDGGPDSSLLQKLNERMPFWDRTIDLVILTHPEKDHMTGLIDLLEQYKIDYFLWTGIIKNSPQSKKLSELLEKAQSQDKNYFLASLAEFKPTKIIFAEPDSDLSAGDVYIDILSPLENLSGQEVQNTNDSSVVVKLIYGENEFIFTGDIGFSIEKKLVSAGIDLSADVLKVAHHGSKYSTSDKFLAVASPEVAVISAGKNNSYGHPTPEVLQRLADFGIETLRTDQKGDITILSDGNKIYIK